MKINVPSLLAGICIAISGSIFASSVSVPYIFTSGQKAKASEINANFSTLEEAINQLTNKISDVENDASTASDFSGAIIKEIISISQIDLPVGSKIAIHGTQYTIVQFEFPRFDTDEPYIIKFPSNKDFSKTFASESIYVGGTFKDESAHAYQQLRRATISGLPATIGEGISFSNNLKINEGTRSTTAEFSQGINVTISIGTRTQIGLYFTHNEPKTTAASKGISTDSSDISHAYPPTPLESEREKIRADLRTLLNYIIIQKKE